ISLDRSACCASTPRSTRRARRSSAGSSGMPPASSRAGWAGTGRHWLRLSGSRPRRARTAPRSADLAAVLEGTSAMASNSDTPVKDLSDRLVKALHLDRVPTAVVWSMKKPEGIQRLDRTLKACQFLDVAGLEGKLFYTDVENNRDCKNGSHYLGLT